MDDHALEKATTYLTQCLDGSCKRTTTSVEHGTALGLVAKRGHDLFTDKEGNLCTSRCLGARASRRPYLVMDGTEMRFTPSNGQATLFPEPSHLLQGVVELVQINCEFCARIEIGNEHQAVKIAPPRRSSHQAASLKAKMKADRTGRPVPISRPKME